MIDIKFRGKCAHSDAWVYGSFVDYGKGETPEIYNFDPYQQGEPEWREIEVDRFTVGQFTGLSDKKGKEIYDGDILYVEYPDGSGGHYLVGWNDKNAAWGAMSAYEYEAKEEMSDFVSFENFILLAHLHHAMTYEVVGNIHDNPELMKVKTTN